MSKDDWGLAVFAIVVLGIVAYALFGLAKVAAQISAALIGVSGVIVVSIIRYSAELRKNRAELEKNRIQNLSLVKQQNYQELLKRIGKFVRDKKNGLDPLTVVHIESWVFGDSEVVEATYSFISDPNQKSLKKLLYAMRKSVEMPDLEFDEDKIGKLFPSKKQEGL